MMEVAAKNSDFSIQRTLVGRKLGRYEILAKIASGGMASVYVARTQGVAGFERLTAIKVLHANLAHEDEFVNMFLDEARLAARIRHTNVVATLDISDTLDAGYYLVMEYIEGDHLGKLLSGTSKAGVRMEIPVVLRIVTDVLCGLSAAHNLTDDSGRKLNLVHRDISPHNIMIGIDGIARLTDFGIAKAENRLSHTRDGQIKGKLGYMAPEYASNGTSDARSDLFSVGIILWECLAYQRLFSASTTADSLRRLLLEPIPPPSSVHKDYQPFDEVLNKALSREVDKRFQSADEFLEALEAVAENCGGIASLRSVAKTVRKYASERIEREKKLIKESLHSIHTANERDDHLPRFSDDPVSDASVKSVSKSSTLSRSSQSESAVSFRSGERSISSKLDTVNDDSSSAKYFQNQASSPSSYSQNQASSPSSYSQNQASSPSSMVGPIPKTLRRTQWFAAIVIAWCVVLSAIAIYATRANEPTSFKVIEISPLEKATEAAEAKLPAVAANPEKVDLPETPTKPKGRAPKQESDSVETPITRTANRIVPTVKNKEDIQRLEKDPSQAATTEGKGKDQGENIVAIDEKKTHRTVRKRASQEASVSISRSSTKNPPTIAKDIQIDEFPAYNPYLSTQ